MSWYEFSDYDERGYLKVSEYDVCMGLAVQWVAGQVAGSLWDSYPYQEHDDDILGWKPNVACVPGRLFYFVAASVEVHPNRNLI